MELYVLRHGEAGKDLAINNKDGGTELTVSGREEVKEVAKGLKKMKLGLDVIASSPLKRAKETAEIVGDVLGVKTVELWDELKPEGQRSALASRLAKLKLDSSVLVVGHEPYLSTLVSDLVSDGGKVKLNLKKSGLVRVDVSSFVPKPRGTLRWLLTAKQVRKMS